MYISAHICFSVYFSWCTSCPSLQPSCLSRMQSPCVVSIPASSKGTACSLLLELTGTLGCLIEWQLFHCLGVWQPPADFSCTLPPFRISFAGGATLWTTQMWLSALIKAFNCAENVCSNLLSSLFCDLWNTWHWSHSWLYLLQHNGCPSNILRPGQGCQGYIQQGLWWVLI